MANAVFQWPETLATFVPKSNLPTQLSAVKIATTIDLTLVNGFLLKTVQRSHEGDPGFIQCLDGGVQTVHVLSPFRDVKRKVALALAVRLDAQPACQDFQARDALAKFVVVHRWGKGNLADGYWGQDL